VPLQPDCLGGAVWAAEVLLNKPPLTYDDDRGQWRKDDRGCFLRTAGWRRLHSFESAISRRDQGGSRGISSQPSAKGAFGRSQTLENNVYASPPLRRAQFPRRGFIK
jgi:hypothetical protein